MDSILDFFRLEDAIEILVLAGMLSLVAGQITNPDFEAYRRTRRVTAVVFLLYLAAGVLAFGASSATDILVIAMRAFLAACMAHGIVLVATAPAAFITGKVKEFAMSRKCVPPPSMESVHIPIIETRDPDSDRRLENERVSKIEDARTLASGFYEEHAELLKEILPPALFTTKIRTRFPDGISPEQAWIAANEIISELVQLLKTASEQKRALEEQDRQRSDKVKEEDRKMQEAEARKGAIERLVEWKRDEEEKIRRLLPADGFDQDDAIRRLADRYDQLMQEALAEARP